MFQLNGHKDFSSSAVTVIGAGPVGLYTGLLLAQAGIEVSIFECEPQVLRSPRAIAYFPVILEEFRHSGILNDVVEAGHKNTIGASWRKPGNGGILAHLGGDDPEKFAIHLGQQELAEIILSHLKHYKNAKVTFNCRLLSFEQSGDKITSLFEYGPEKTPLEHVSRYLVGADGGKSMVRKTLGIPLNGYTWEDFNIVAANIVYDMEKLTDWGPANFVVDPEYWAVVAKVGKGPNWRVASGERNVDGVTEEMWNEETALRRLRTRMAKILDGPVEQVEVVAISPYKMHQRCVPEFVKGNVVLAGDAAHLTNPVGGLGLTTGFLDASFFAYIVKKILLEGGDSVTLLKEYGDVRRKAFVDYTSPTAITNHQRLLSTNPATIKDREEFFAKINQRDKAFLAGMFNTEMGMSTTPH